ncbi:MAG: class I mannose-6-phosphate isomerase [Isosphaeraceae bacterium]|nr:class I mannose-6-phosphate isomerase [Isosphaeraceae bacterium]
MSATPLYPLRFEPILKELIWGGRRLESVLGKTLGAGAHYAESWEVADHRDDVSRVAEGPLKGVSLRDLVRERGEEVLGPALGPRAQFPLLVKFLDAHQVLSVQVHPDDALGRKLADDNGKTEAWVVIHVEPGGRIYAGLRPGVTRDEFAAAIAAGAVEPLLHQFEPRPGDCILIPAGTVHAIGAGVVLAEIQQMSDATFRVFDWGRLGPDGKPRQLHVAQALESTDYAAGPVEPIAPQAEPIEGGLRERLARCPYFALERLRLESAAGVGSAERFTILLGLGGTAEVWHGGVGARLGFGQTLLLPAALGTCAIAPANAGEAVVLTCVVS